MDRIIFLDFATTPCLCVTGQLIFAFVFVFLWVERLFGEIIAVELWWISGGSPVDLRWICSKPCKNTGFLTGGSAVDLRWKSGGFAVDFGFHISG